MREMDQIERTVILPVPPHELWEVLTQPEHLTAWFGTCWELDLRPGGAATFAGDDGQPIHAVVETVEQPRHFAFRWRFDESPAIDDVGELRGTLVEFTLDEVPEGTALRFVESGFARIWPVREMPAASLLAPDHDAGYGDLPTSLPVPILDTEYVGPRTLLRARGWDGDIQGLVAYINMFVGA